MKRYEVKINQSEGEETFILSDNDEHNEAEIIPSIGNNLIRWEVRGKPIILSPSKLSTLRNEKFAVFKYGIPILSPPNRVKNGIFFFKNRKYELPLNEPPNHLHGELCSKAWNVIKYDANEQKGAFVTSVFKYEDHPEMLEYFPHKMSYQITYGIKEDELHMRGKITNESDDEVPFSFGFHPYFAISKVDEVEIIIPAVEEWPVTSQAFVEGLPQKTDYCEQLRNGVLFSEFPELGVHLVRIDENNSVCQLNFKNKDIRMLFELDSSFPFIVIFKPNWASAVSFEPYTCITDAFNLPWPDKTTGAMGLRAKEEFSFTWKMILINS